MLKKWNIYCFAFLLFFLSGLSLQANASPFPNDAKEVVLDVHSGTTGVLLASSTNSRTILYSSITTNASDGHICISPAGSCSANPTILKLEDTEVAANSRDEHYHNYLLSAGTDISWNKNASNDKQFMTLVYVDYNIASSTDNFNCLNCASSSTPQVIGTSTPATSTPVMNIQDIGYRATTTVISSGVSITDAVYTMPSILLRFVFAILAMTIILLSIWLFFKRNNGT